MNTCSPSRGRLRAKKRRSGSRVVFKKVQRSPSLRKTTLRSHQRITKLEALLGRVNKFIAHRHDGLELATAHHKRCTILSSLGRHKEALQASQKACYMLKKRALRMERAALEDPTSRDRARESLVFSWLAIAIYAEGVEHEYLGLKSLSENLFAAAVNVAKSKLGSQHATTKRLRGLVAPGTPRVPPQRKHIPVKKTVRRKRQPRDKARRTQNKRVSPNRALATSARDINSMESMLHKQKTKRMTARRRRLHTQKCDEALAVLHALGQQALLSVAVEMQELEKAEAASSPSESPSEPSMTVGELEAASPAAAHMPSPATVEVKSEEGGAIAFTQEEVGVVLYPVQQAMKAAAESQALLMAHPNPDPAAERYWQCVLASPSRLGINEADAVLTKLRHCLLTMINQRASNRNNDDK